MHNRHRAWLWLAAAVSFVVGFILVLNDSGAGWFLIIMGIIDIGATTRAGRGLAASNRGMIRWGLLVATLLLLMLVLIAAAILLVRH